MLMVNQLVGFGGGSASYATIGTPTTLGTGVVSTVSATIATMTTTAAITAGNLAVVAVFSNATNPATCTGVSDGTNTYTKAVGLLNASTDVSIWYKANASAVASGATITATFNQTGGSGSQATVQAAQVTNIALVPPLDATASNVASPATTVTATTSSLVQPVEIAFAQSIVVSGAGTTTYTQASGFTLINRAEANLNGPSILDYKQVSDGSAVSHTPTWGTSGKVVSLVATFKAQTL